MDSREMTEKKVFSYMEEHSMVSPRDKIVAGVSGGADSVCLLFLLSEYSRRVPLSLAVVHVNHGLRRDAHEDARFVEEICARMGLPFFLEHADVHRLAREQKCSLEDAGRRVRYEAFGRAADSLGGGKIAVAHNADDNAETMLLHLFRGSGLKGLCGILPVREDIACGTDIIRPILCLERREAEAYLRGRGISWRRDSTNNGDDYTRNRIRHHVLPYAEREVSGGVVSHLCRTAEILRETEDFLEKQTEEALERCMVSAAGETAGVCMAGAAEETAGMCMAESVGTASGNRRPSADLGHGTETWEAPGYYALDIEAFRTFHIALQKRMLLALGKKLSPTGKDISAVHVRDLLTLFREEANRSISLPFGITARRQYANVILEAGRTAPGGAGEGHPGDTGGMVPPLEEILDSPFVYDMGSLGRIEFTAFFIKKGQEVPKNQYTKWFDYDKIEESVVIRTRRAGDYLTISDGAGNMRHKALKDYMITEKIPRQQRDRIPVAAAGSHILWLVGWRISEHFKVCQNTERILQIRYL